MSKLNIVVVDDHALFRAGLISLLAEMAEFEIVGEAENGHEALEVISRTNPEVVLLDVNMPGMSGVDVVQALRNNTSTRIIMLTISKSEQDLLGAITAGADGYILKNAEPEELKRAILMVSKGFSVLSPQVTRQVFDAINLDSSSVMDSDLSTREMEVLECLAKGRTTQQIAGDLFISENTVKTHVRHILEKLEASNRAEAVSKALRMGMIGKKG